MAANVTGSTGDEDVLRHGDSKRYERQYGNNEARNGTSFGYNRNTKRMRRLLFIGIDCFCYCQDCRFLNNNTLNAENLRNLIKKNSKN